MVCLIFQPGEDVVLRSFDVSSTGEYKDLKIVLKKMLSCFSLTGEHMKLFGGLKIFNHPYFDKIK